MKRAVIFLNGELSDLRQAKEEIRKGDFIICADGGMRHVLALGITPNALLGDFDSLPGEWKSKLPTSAIILPHPTEKNQYEADAELAIRYAKAQGYRTILVFGFLGRRVDHIASNFGHFATANIDCDIRIIEGNQTIYFIQNNQKKIYGQVGDLISLVPFAGKAAEASITGVKWTLKKVTLPLGSTLGISNVFTNNVVIVTVNKGILIVVHTKKDEVR